jgi:hypothetical protein
MSGPASGAYEQQLSNNFNALTNQLAVNNSPLLNMPNVNPTSNGLTTWGEVKSDFLTGAGMLYTYKAFGGGSALRQARTLIHEGQHFYAGAYDWQLAGAAGVPGAHAGMDVGQASYGFNQKLWEKCK